MSRNVIDLSYTVEHAMEVFPADPPVGILKHHCYKNGYFVSQIINAQWNACRCAGT